MAGYQRAIDEGMHIIVKIDGDGQMDPKLIPSFIKPLVLGHADYTKGNRFFDLEGVVQMPRIRLVGNAVLSFMNKLSSGYWDVFDPTNGYTAIHHVAAKRLPLSKISQRYFFETDMLFRLNISKAVVVDVPMVAKYGAETSHLKISKVIGEFAFKHGRNFFKRIFYNYYLRDMSIASIELPLGASLMVFGILFGTVSWMKSIEGGLAASAGTVMLSALPIIVGMQLLLGFLNQDIRSVPRRALQQVDGNSTVTDSANY